MARTIGRKNKEIVRKTTKRIFEKYEKKYNYEEIIDRVIKELPDEMFDIWEGAYSEILTTIEDTLDELID